MWLIVKAFVLFPLACGLIQGCLSIFSMHGNLGKAIFIGFIKGLALSSFLMLSHYVFFKMAIKREFKPASFEPKQRYCFEMNACADDVFNLAETALKSLDWFILKSSNRAEGIIEGETKISWKSFKEIIKLEIEKTADNNSQLIISSVPAKKFTMFDYGKNYENIKAIYTILKTHIRQPGTA